jgi:hypothetical protein
MSPELLDAPKNWLELHNESGNHHTKNQGHAVWDDETQIYEGQQFFCDDCQMAWIVVEKSEMKPK